MLHTLHLLLVVFNSGVFMQNTVLVTGANGHLGNNLVRVLLGKGEKIVAGIRNPANRAALADLECDITQIDLLDRSSLVKAMTGVSVLYQVGAVFKHWAKDPEREIYQANLQGTRNALEAAAEAGVRRIVYVSSLGALDRSRTPITETTWNPVTSNVYSVQRSILKNSHGNLPGNWHWTSYPCCRAR
ncbi:MAG: NAD-dependent epimerase/dehydratase family protein [Acidithiobacillus sp.]